MKREGEITFTADGRIFVPEPPTPDAELRSITENAQARYAEECYARIQATLDDFYAGPKTRVTSPALPPEFENTTQEY